MKYLVISSQESIKQATKAYGIFDALHDTESKAHAFAEEHFENDDVDYVIVGITKDNFNKLVADDSRF